MWRRKSVHAVAIVFVAVFAEEFDGAVEALDGDRGMMDAVEGGGLDGGVVNHVLEDDFVANGEGLGELPIAHEVAREAGVAAEAIAMDSGQWTMDNVFCATHLRIIGHFEAVGHVAGEADVEDGGFDAVVLHDINYGGHEGACLPGEGTAGFEDHAEVWPAGVEVLQGADEELDVITLARHEMSTAEVDPLELGEPGGELINNMYERAREGIGTTLAMAVDMETLDGSGEVVGRWQVLGQNAKARAWGAGVIEFGLYLAVLGVDAEAEGGLRVEG